MNCPIMPKEFAEIARLSLESWPPYTGSKSPKTMEEDLKHGMFVRQPIELAIMKLSDEQLKQLIGWTTFGRDCAGAENPVEELAACITRASVRDRNQAVNYIIEKPIHKYLQKAEENLRISKASSSPVHAGR